jgi:antirestriction protein ArdC
VTDLRAEKLEAGEKGSPTFRPPPYGLEELIARNVGRVSVCGIGNIAGGGRQRGGYILDWLAKLRSDKRMVVPAAAHVQRAADYILKSVIIR